ncbi:hypothetical protein HYT33_02465 [Candidatus Roizmanbacteria bacterium]|nr:hypothetical protein [Candidatus Roizmanbacteria bacterium]
MRIVGIILVSIGVALLLFVGFSYLKERNKTVSPIPEDRGVKVIFITPTP